MAVGLTLPWDLALLERGGWGWWVVEWGGEHNMNDYRCSRLGSSSSRRETKTRYADPDQKDVLGLSRVHWANYG